MHLIWENLIPNLVLLWTGGFNGLDEGSGEYQFEKGVWEAIGMATAAAGSTIPSAFGAQPPNPATVRDYCGRSPNSSRRVHQMGRRL